MGIFNGSQRSKAIKMNAVGALAIKVVAMFIQLIQVPIVLSYLDSMLYGIYLTITSIVVWTHNFDFGLGNGLRFKLTESISQNNVERSKSLVSTAYFSLAIIMGCVGLCAVPFVFNLNWNDILNCDILSNSYLALCVIIVLFTILLQFVLELVSIVLQADQKAAISTVFKPIANIISLSGILILKYLGTHSLLGACIVLTLPIVIVLLLANVFFFVTRYGSISPSIRFYDKSVLKDIYSLGLKFFITSLAGLVVFNSTNFLLSYFINPVEVSVYQTAYTYFSTIVVFFTVFLTPFMAGVTDAFVNRDNKWLKNCMRKLCLLTCAFSLMIIGLLLISKFVFHIWIGDRLEIPVGLCIVLSIYFIGNLWSATYNCFVVGIGKAQLSMYISVFKIMLFLPIAILLIKSLGTIGIVVATIVVNTLPNIIFGYLQYKLVVNHKATGIWNK